MENTKTNEKKKLIKKIMEDKKAILDCIEQGGNLSTTLKDRGIELV